MLTAFLGMLVCGALWIALALSLERYALPLLETTGLTYGQSGIFHLPYAIAFGGIIGFVLTDLRTRNPWLTFALLFIWSLLFGIINAKWWSDDSMMYPNSGELVAIYGPMAIMSIAVPTIAFAYAVLSAYRSSQTKR